MRSRPSAATSVPKLPPSTRYQGSKRKLLGWLREIFEGLEFDTALDLFGGTASVSYLLKGLGKAVTYNDALKFNALVGRAIVENAETTLGAEDLETLLEPPPDPAAEGFIARTFGGIYYTDEENRWLDAVCGKLQRIDGDPAGYKRALGSFTLFQACLCKRPYNLFHRKNLSMRTAEVRRGFGNKATWDRPFEELVRRFAAEANAAVFDSGLPCRAECRDAFDVAGDFDLVYIDPPYVNRRGVGVDYRDFYHFLEGIVDYPSWPERVDYGRKHRPLLRETQGSAWSDPSRVGGAFRRLFAKYANSLLVVSYRSDGIPSVDELAAMMREVKAVVEVSHYGSYRYVLSTNAESREVVLVGR